MKRPLLTLLALCLLTSVAHARMNAQGVLRDADGNLLEGDLAVTFSIHETATGVTPLWTETQTVTLVRGVFNTLLPQDPQANPWPSGLFWSDDPRWLEIQPEAQSALLRTLVAAVPRAMSAHHAGVAHGLSCSGCVSSAQLAAQVLQGSALGFDDSTSTLGVNTVQGAIDALSAGLDDHAQNPDAHHPANSEGVHIKPASVQVGDSQLHSGNLDLGPDADDALTAAMVKTLTGGGDADALHTHASAGAGGAFCYTSWGNVSCGEGFAPMYSGEAVVPAITQKNGNNWYLQERSAVASMVCASSEGIDFTSVGGSHRPRYHFGNDKHVGKLPCAVCCK